MRIAFLSIFILNIIIGCSSSPSDQILEPSGQNNNPPNNIAPIYHPPADIDNPTPSNNDAGVMVVDSGNNNDDASVNDASYFDVENNDASTIIDAGENDSSIIVDADIIDANVMDAAIDSGSFDSGIVDSGSIDSGNVDAGAIYNQIDYHGGPIMTGTPTIYLIWYGDWSNNTATTLIPQFIQQVSGSAYLKTNTTYYDINGNHLSGSINYGGSYYMTGSTFLLSKDESDIINILNATWANYPQLPFSDNAIYLVLTSPNIQIYNFCTKFCGWHSSAKSTTGNITIKFGLIGNPQTQCINACSGQATISPNNNLGADAMISVIAHEIDEALTDPEIDSYQNGTGWWRTSTGDESADLCAWKFGTTYQVSNGSFANLKLGSSNYLVQENWINAGGGYCSMY